MYTTLLGVRRVQQAPGTATADEVVVMKDAADRVIGFEILHYKAPDSIRDLEVETFVMGAS
jgi:hypothetical protein